MLAAISNARSKAPDALKLDKLQESFSKRTLARGHHHLRVGSGSDWESYCTSLRNLFDTAGISPGLACQQLHLVLSLNNNNPIHQDKYTGFWVIW